MDGNLLLLFVLLPIAVFVIVRMASSAYFSAKFDHMRKVTKHVDSQTDDNP